MPDETAFSAPSEQCWICFQLYAYEQERRCVCCDAGVCPFCGAERAVGFLCFPCEQEEEHERARDVEG